MNKLKSIFYASLLIVITLSQAQAGEDSKGRWYPEGGGWYGTAPSCNGNCPNSTSFAPCVGASSNGNCAYSKTTGYAPSHGHSCSSGRKAYCVTKDFYPETVSNTSWLKNNGKWRGTAPACNGNCNDGEISVCRSSNGKSCAYTKGIKASDLPGFGHSCSSGRKTYCVPISSVKSEDQAGASAYNICDENDYSCQKQVAKKFSPLLRFDQKQGQAKHCFPSDAGEYYTAKNLSGDYNKDLLVCNTDYDSIRNNEIPTYFEYQGVKNTPYEYLQYWFFTGYQEPCFAGQGEHDADWERVIVKLYRGKIVTVTYYQHKGYYTRNIGHFQLHEDNHPVVYVGKNSHGSYHDDGGSGGCLYYEDFRNPGSADQQMRTWNNMVHLTTEGPEWMSYNGKWDKARDKVQSPLFRSEPKMVDRKACKSDGCTKSDIADKCTLGLSCN